jgi:hypothetical protein
MIEKKNRKARVIAYYLPQYHPIPENDEWWGKGFTEWTNVGKATPLFKGHYQPRVPADLGYYDLRMPEVREAQAALAQSAGIEGFMYWHYWFGNGRRVLERVFTEVLRSKKPDYPFCLGWANHSWNNHEWNPVAQWERRRNIIEQTYPGVEDYTNHFNSLLDAFRDERYITVDGKPLFMIYNVLEIPDAKMFFALWNDLAVKNGLKGIHFVGGASSLKTKQVLSLGVDAVNSNGQWMAEERIRGRVFRILYNRINRYIGGLSLDKYDYKDIVKYLYNEHDTLENVYPIILPQWDRSPRSGRRAVIYTGSTPELFGENVRTALSLVENKAPEHRIIFLKSWNEWAEGNYIEPDIVYGRRYLDVLGDLLK